MKPNLQLHIEDAYWYAFATTRDYEDLYSNRNRHLF